MLGIKQINFFDIVILLGAVQGLLFAVYLWIKPLNNKRASLSLSIFILSFAASSIYYTLESMGLRGRMNAWDFAPLFSSLTIIVAFYFFIRYLVNPKRRLSILEKLLFFPPLAQFIFQCFGLLKSLTDRQFLVDNEREVYQFYDLVDFLTLILGVTVLVLNVLRLKSYEGKLKDNFAEISDFTLGWLQRLLYLIFGVWILFAIPMVYELMTGYSPYNIYYPIWISTSFMIYWIGYSTLKHRFTISPNLPIKEVETTNKLSDKTETYHTSLIQLMREEKLYLDEHLSLEKLASHLSISGGYLSQIINQYEEKNFFDFVNGYRVNAFKENVQNPSFNHLNLLGIAFESGFKSKSTFNLVFKKVVGMTPSAYKKSIGPR